MLVTTLEELRLYSPANALDNIQTISGYLDSSEHDFLEDKLGTPLYESLLENYRNLVNSNGISTFIDDILSNNPLSPYQQLLSLAQRCITFDALGRSIDMQAISVNGSGVNVSTADNYGKAEEKTIQAYKATCYRESHAAVNRLLTTLESWVKIEKPKENAKENSDTEKAKIAELWQKSRYYYLAASLIIPSAEVLQEYLNIYDNREKFITMLPDLRYIQEDIVAPVIGEDLLEKLIDTATKGTQEKLLLRIIHYLRKATARHLESRTMAIKVGDPRKEQAHDEAVALLSSCAEYIKVHQQDFLEDWTEVLKLSPLYIPVATESSNKNTFENNQDGNVIFVTPSLN